MSSYTSISHCDLCVVVTLLYYVLIYLNPGSILLALSLWLHINQPVKNPRFFRFKYTIKKLKICKTQKLLGIITQFYA